MSKPTSFVLAQEWTEFRRKHLFTQEKLAQSLGLCRRTVQNVEHGRHYPTAETLSRFRALKLKFEGAK